MSNNPSKLPNNVIVHHVLLDEIHELIVCNNLLIHIAIDRASEVDVVVHLVVAFFMLIDTYNNVSAKMLSILMFIHQDQPSGQLGPGE